MRFPESAALGTLFDVVGGETVRAPIVSGKEHITTAKELREGGKNILIVANHFAGIDPEIDINIAEQIGPLSDLSIFISQRQLDSSFKGPIMRNGSRAKGFTILPVIQKLQRDQVNYEALLALEQIFRPGNTSIDEIEQKYEAIQAEIKRAKLIDKHERVHEDEKFPLCTEFNKRSFAAAVSNLRGANGKMVLIFPEGHRSPSGQMQKAEDGATALLRLGRENTVVLPIAIEMGKIMPKATMGKLRVFPFGLTKSKVRVASPMTWEHIQNIAKRLNLELKDALMLLIAINLPEKQQGYYAKAVSTFMAKTLSIDESS